MLAASTTRSRALRSRARLGRRSLQGLARRLLRRADSNLNAAEFILNAGAGAEFTGAAQRAMGVHVAKSGAGLPMRSYAPCVAGALLAMHAALGCGCGSGSSVAQAG